MPNPSTSPSEDPRQHDFLLHVPAADPDQLDDDIENRAGGEREEQHRERGAHPCLADERPDERRGAADDAENGEERPARTILVAGERSDDAEALGRVVEAEADHQSKRQTELVPTPPTARSQALREVVETNAGRDEDRKPARRGHRHDVLLDLVLGHRRGAGAEHGLAATAPEPAVIQREAQEPDREIRRVEEHRKPQKAPAVAAVSAPSTGSTAAVSTSQRRKSRIPVAHALRNDFVPRLIDCMRPTGRPRKIVQPRHGTQEYNLPRAHVRGTLHDALDVVATSATAQHWRRHGPERTGTRSTSTSRPSTSSPSRSASIALRPARPRSRRASPRCSEFRGRQRARC